MTNSSFVSRTFGSRNFDREEWRGELQTPAVHIKMPVTSCDISGEESLCHGTPTLVAYRTGYHGSKMTLVTHAIDGPVIAMPTPLSARTNGALTVSLLMLLHPSVPKRTLETEPPSRMATGYLTLLDNLQGGVKSTGTTTKGPLMRWGRASFGRAATAVSASLTPCCRLNFRTERCSRPNRASDLS